MFISLFFGALLLIGCKQTERPSKEGSANARALFEQTVREFHAPSAEAQGAERERLLNQAAKNYERLITEFPTDHDLCAQALRGLGSVRASQGKTDEAVKLYASVGEKYQDLEWEVLQAWKAAGDLLWDANRRDDAKKFYAKIVGRFGKGGESQIIQTVVRGSKARLAE